MMIRALQLDMIWPFGSSYRYNNKYILLHTVLPLHRISMTINEKKWEFVTDDSNLSSENYNTIMSHNIESLKRLIYFCIHTLNSKISLSVIWKKLLCRHTVIVNHNSLQFDLGIMRNVLFQIMITDVLFHKCPTTVIILLIYMLMFPLHP